MASPENGSTDGAQPADTVPLSLDQEIDSVYVQFQGLKRVSPHCLIRECLAFRHARTLGDVQVALEDAYARLNELNLLKSLRADVSIEHNGVVDITFITEEKKRLLTMSGHVDKKGEMSADVRMEQPALLGGPLSLSGSAGSTMSQARNFLLQLSTPRFLGRRYTWNFDVARSSSDEKSASSYSECQTSAAMKLADADGTHTVALEAALRDIHPASSGSRFPSLEIQMSRLSSVKTSVKYSFAQMWQTHHIPGGLFSLRSDFEAAGLAGDVRFLRGETFAHAIVPLPWNLRWASLWSCGLLRPLDTCQSCLQDRFFLGGATGSTAIFKGFADRGIGPSGICQLRNTDRSPGQHKGRGTDALGGDVMMNAFSAISLPVMLPSRAVGEGVQVHVFGFAGMGSIAARSHGGLRTLTQNLRDGSRASAGVGLAIPFAGMGSLEFTFAQPMWIDKHDQCQRWQVGLRMDFKG